MTGAIIGHGMFWVGKRRLYTVAKPRLSSEIMTPETVQYSLQGQVAKIRIDDGKRNALSPQVLRELYLNTHTYPAMRESLETGP